MLLLLDFSFQVFLEFIAILFHEIATSLVKPILPYNVTNEIEKRVDRSEGREFE